jgi:hypothetical protein
LRTLLSIARVRESFLSTPPPANSEEEAQAGEIGCRYDPIQARKIQIIDLEGLKENTTPSTLGTMNYLHNIVVQDAETA